MATCKDLSFDHDPHGHDDEFEYKHSFNKSQKARQPVVTKRVHVPTMISYDDWLEQFAQSLPSWDLLDEFELPNEEYPEERLRSLYEEKKCDFDHYARQLERTQVKQTKEAKQAKKQSKQVPQKPAVINNNSSAVAEIADSADDIVRRAEAKRRNELANVKFAQSTRTQKDKEEAIRQAAEKRRQDVRYQEYLDTCACYHISSFNREEYDIRTGPSFGPGALWSCWLDVHTNISCHIGFYDAKYGRGASTRPSPADFARHRSDADRERVRMNSDWYDDMTRDSDFYAAHSSWKKHAHASYQSRTNPQSTTGPGARSQSADGPGARSQPTSDSNTRPHSAPVVDVTSTGYLLQEGLRLLGATLSSKPIDVKTTYRQLAMQYHPDKLTTDEEKEQSAHIFTAVSIAMTQLKKNE
jgi:DnaJ-domain-containing protein 1